MRSCITCDEVHDGGHPIVGGSACDRCWKALLPMATSRLGYRIKELLPTVSSVTISRAIATALPEVLDRRQLWFDLQRPGQPAFHGTPRATPQLRNVARELRELGVLGIAVGPRRSQVDRVKSECTGCGRIRQVAGRINDRPMCSTCWQAHPTRISPCSRCGIPAFLSRVKLCTKCRSLDSGAAVFTPERILADPSLERAKAILDAADGDYLARMIKAGGPWSLLKEVVTSPGPIVHDRLDKAGTASSTRSLRAFLVAVGILPPRNEALHALEEWVVRRSELIRGTEDRNAFIRFARWRHLRRSRTGPLNSAQADGHRYELSVVFAYIDDLHTHGRTLRTATQQHLERWLAAGTPERRRVNLFLNWCRTSSINRNLNPPIRLRSASSLTPRRLAEATQAELLSTMLAPETPLDPALRLAASLVLLYGIRTHQIVGLRTSDIIEDGRGTSVRIGDEPLRLPTALAGWAQQIGSASVVGRFGGRSRDAEWIFPSPLHGRAVSPQTLGNRLRAIGVSPGDARGSAVSQLALQLPPAVLSRLLGVAPRTATGWVAAVSASQSRYVPAVLGR